MPRRKPKNKATEKELDIKDKLEGIILADEMLAGLSAPDIPPISKPMKFMDMEEVKSSVETEARAILESLAKFYNDFTELPDDDYRKHKQKMDALNISTLTFQIRTAQHVIAKMVEEVDAGNTNAGFLAALSQLQSQLMQMPKNFASYIAQMEKSYKDLKKEAEENKEQKGIRFNENGDLEESQENIEALKVRGTKSLMENLQTLMKGGNMIQDAKIVPPSKPDNDLIDPRRGGTSEAELLGGGIDEEGTEFNIDDDIF